MVSNWINSEIGVKQGCVLSPLLFALYIRDLGPILEQENQGYKIGKLTIPALLFADDLVIIAESKEELEVQLQSLTKFTIKKRIELNYNKSEIMKRGPGLTTAGQWEIHKGESKLKTVLSETNFYKYLGIRFGRNKTYQHQKQYIKTSLPRRLGMMKAKAKDTDNSIWIRNMLWKQITKPGLLYGSETIIYDKEWIRWLEAAQGKAGRWILGLPKTTSYLGVRGELGWSTMRGEIMKNKVHFLGKILGMNKTRWSYQMMLEIATFKKGNSWMSEVRKAMDELKITWIDLSNRNWEKILMTKWKDWEQIYWEKEKKTARSLKLYPKVKLLKRAWHLEFSKASRMMTKFRIGNLQELIEGSICRLCGSMIKDNIITHVWSGCIEGTPVLNHIKRKLRLYNGVDGNDIGKLINLLNKSHWKYLAKLYNMIAEVKRGPKLIK